MHVIIYYKFAIGIGVKSMEAYSRKTEKYV
jgi:hypothetical protein